MRGEGVFARAAALASVLHCGCTAVGTKPVPHESVVAYSTDSWPVVVTAPVGGEYSLRIAEKSVPVVTVDVESGSRIGFQRAENGVVLAVAGHWEIPLDSARRHYWVKN